MSRICDVIAVRVFRWNLLTVDLASEQIFVLMRLIVTLDSPCPLAADAIWDRDWVCAPDPVKEKSLIVFILGVQVGDEQESLNDPIAMVAGTSVDARPVRAMS